VTGLGIAVEYTEHSSDLISAGVVTLSPWATDDEQTMAHKVYGAIVAAVNTGTLREPFL
jgi:hypothetical protein